MLSLVTLGRLELRDGEAVLLPRRRRELVLLAVLARRAPRPIARGELAALLWGTRDDARARQSLRQALGALRPVVGDALLATGDDVRVDSRHLRLDARALEDALAAGDAGAAVAAWGGDFLPGAEELGHDDFRAWLERERAALRRALATAYARLVEDARAAGQPAAEAAHALAWSEALPLDEAAQHRLVDALRRAGRTAEARARYHDFAARLRDDIGVDPAPALARLGASLDADATAVRVGARALLTPDLVGRSDVMGRLLAAWRRAREGRGAVVLLAGDEGSGRSRLCRELVRVVRDAAAAGEPCVVLEGRAFASEREHPWAALRGALAGLADAPGLVAAPPAALAAVAMVVPEVAERFPRLVAETGAMPVADAVARALAEVAAEVPLLLVLDDATDADAASAAVLGALVRRPPAGALVLLTARADALAASPLAADLRQAGGHATAIELPPLDVEAVAALAASMMPLAPELAHPLAERLHREASGNPAQVEALLAAWADAGLLRVRPDGRWIATCPLDGALPIPAGLRAGALDRLRHVSPDSRRVAEAASVWTGDVVPALLERAAGVRGDRFASALGELLSRRVLRESALRPGTYAWTSEASRRGVHDALAPSRRRALHRAAAAALRALPPGYDRDRRLREHLALAGRGFSWGGASWRPWLAAAGVAVAVMLGGAQVVGPRASAEPARPVPLLLADVENASADSTLGRTFQVAAAARLQDARQVALVPRARVREALARMRRPDAPLTEALAREVALREGVGTVLVLGVSQVDSSFLLTARLLDAARGTERDARTARVTGRGALLAGLDRLLADVRRDLGEVRRWPGGGPPPLPRITTSSLDALRALVDGRAAYARTDYALAQQHFERAVALDPDFALAHAFLSDAHFFGRGDRAAARAALERAVALADRASERERLRILGQMQARFGSADEATSWFRLLAQRYPDRDTWYTLGSHLAATRRCAEALPALERSLALDPGFSAVTYLVKARCHVAAGDATAALAAFAGAARVDSLALARGPANQEWGAALVLAGRAAAAESAFRPMLARPVPADRMRGHRSLAWLALHGGRDDEAAAHLRAGIATSVQARLALPELRDRLALAEVLVALGDRAGAARELDQVAARARLVAVPAAIRLHEGLAAVRTGRRTQARAALGALAALADSGALADAAARATLEGALLLDAGDAAGAVRRLAEVEPVPEHRAQRLALLARAHAAMGRADSARAIVRRLDDPRATGGEDPLDRQVARLRARGL